ARSRAQHLDGHANQWRGRSRRSDPRMPQRPRSERRRRGAVEDAGHAETRGPGRVALASAPQRATSKKTRYFPWRDFQRKLVYFPWSDFQRKFVYSPWRNFQRKVVYFPWRGTLVARPRTTPGVGRALPFDQ